MGMDPPIWIAVGALLVSIIFGVLNTSHNSNSNSDIQAQLDDARKQAAQVSQAQTVNDSVNAIMLGQTDQVTQAKTTDDSVNAIMLALTDLAASVADIQSKLTK